MLAEDKRKQSDLNASGIQNDFDLIGGNKIILFQKKEIAWQQLQQQGAVNLPDLRLSLKILGTQSTRLLKRRLELPEAKDGVNISYAMYLPSKEADKYYTNMAAKAVLESNQGRGSLGKTISQILQSCNNE